MTEPVWGAASDIGAVRKQNQDAVRAETPVFVVADGMGGHAAGEVASALVIEQFAALGQRDRLGTDDVIDTVAAANRAILAWSSEHPETEGMGTTATGVCLGNVDGERCWIVFNIGDSRVYRFADGVLAQVTTDHSEVQQLVEGGALTPEQARHYIRRNIVTRSLGVDWAPEPDLWVLPIVPGERFLACSDGLTNEVDDAGITAVLATGTSPQEAADTLVAMAVKAGGHDNVSVVVVDAP